MRICFRLDIDMYLDRDAGVHCPETVFLGFGSGVGISSGQMQTAHAP